MDIGEPHEDCDGGIHSRVGCGIGHLAPRPALGSSPIVAVERNMEPKVLQTLCGPARSSLEQSRSGHRFLPVLDEVATRFHKQVAQDRERMKQLIEDAAILREAFDSNRDAILTDCDGILGSTFFPTAMKDAAESLAILVRPELFRGRCSDATRSMIGGRVAQAMSQITPSLAALPGGANAWVPRITRLIDQGEAVSESRRNRVGAELARKSSSALRVEGFRIVASLRRALVEEERMFGRMPPALREILKISSGTRVVRPAAEESVEGSAGSNSLPVVVPVANASAA